MERTVIITLLAIVILVSGGCQTLKPTDNLGVGDKTGFKSLKIAFNNGLQQNGTVLKSKQPTNDDICGIVGANKEFFNNLADTFKFSLESSQNELPPQEAVLSMYFDSFRLLNRFIQLNLTRAPQQQKSPANITVLESLDKGSSSNIKKIDDSGYVILDEKAVQENQLKNKRMKNKRNGDNGNQESQGSTNFHDILVMLAASSGVKHEDGTLAYSGYLSKISGENLGIERFFPEPSELILAEDSTKKSDNSDKQTDLGNNLSTHREEDVGKLLSDSKRQKSFFPILYETVALSKSNIVIISSSFAFEAGQLQRMENEINNSDTTKKFDIPMKDRQDNYLVVLTLKNKMQCSSDLEEKDEKFCDGKKDGSYVDHYAPEQSYLAPLISLKNRFGENLILVSVFRPGLKHSEFNSRLGLKNAKIEFFSVPGNYTISLQGAADGSVNATIENQPATSFATPLLSAIIFNLASISPSLSSSQIKDILKKSAVNYEANDKKNVDPTEYGYIVTPDEAYKLAMGSLIANVQREYYHCKSKQINLVRNNDRTWKWIVQCNQNGNQTENQSGDVNYSYKSDILSDFYQESTKRYVSAIRTGNGDVIQVSESKSNQLVPTVPINKSGSSSSTKGGSTGSPEKIVIKDLKMVDYTENGIIVVEFNKEFCSPTYRDATEKRMKINYVGRNTETGTPRLDEELVLDTKSETDCETVNKRKP